MPAFKQKDKVDPVTGQKIRRHSDLAKLNSKHKLSKQEMDDLFLDESEW